MTTFLAETDFMGTIFLSHSSQNNFEAIALRDWLASEGWDDVFLDLDPERGIKAGERWQDALKRASANCELVLFLISPAWVASKWCQTEFLLAKQMNKRIFAAVVEDTPFDDIPVEMTAEWQIIDLTAGVERREIPVRFETTGQSATVRFTEDGLERLKIGLRAAGLDPKVFAWPPAHDPGRAPFQGLRALDEDDAGIFFGRDGPIVEGLDNLRGLREAAPPRMYVILGASGAGKSSYMRAGLLPRLRRDSQAFRVLPVVRPNTAVLEGDSGLIVALERALREAGADITRAAIRDACAAGPEAVGHLLAPVMQATLEGAPAPTLILPIDQGEELFQADGAEEAQRFLTLLQGLLRQVAPAVIAMVTIRSDTYEPLQSARALEGIAQQTYSLPPIPRGAYSEVVLGPAQRLSDSGRPFRIEEQLVSALLQDIETSEAKDSLPLLAFTLERLYRDYGGDNDLKLSEYEHIGRIGGAIKAAVSEALDKADAIATIPKEPRERLALLRRAMIPALATVDPDTGVPRRRVALLRDIPPQTRPLVDLLIDQRLLATDVLQDGSAADGEVTVEPAHEALLRQWDLLNGWLQEEAEDLGSAEAIRRGARDWVGNGRDAEWLSHAAGRLLNAEQVAARPDFAKLFGPDERAYLAACRAAEERRRDEAEAIRLRDIKSQKQRRNILAAALCVTLVLLGLAGWQWSVAGQNAQRAEAQRQLAEEQTQEAERQSQRAEQAATRWLNETLHPSYQQNIAKILTDGTIPDAFGQDAAIAPLRILPETAGNWHTLISLDFRGQPRPIVATGLVDQGRVAAFGHDALISQSTTTEAVLKDAMRWLSKTRIGGQPDRRHIGIATGHGEIIHDLRCGPLDGGWPCTADELLFSLAEWGFDTSIVAGKIDAAALSGLDALIIGNATRVVCEDELEAIDQFVRDGGGLALSGLLWAWQETGPQVQSQFGCPGPALAANASKLDRYPPNTIGRKFGVLFDEMIWRQ